MSSRERPSWTGFYFSWAPGGWRHPRPAQVPGRESGCGCVGTEAGHHHGSLLRHSHGISTGGKLVMAKICQARRRNYFHSAPLGGSFLAGWKAQDTLSCSRCGRSPGRWAEAGPSRNTLHVIQHAHASYVGQSAHERAALVYENPSPRSQTKACLNRGKKSNPDPPVPFQFFSSSSTTTYKHACTRTCAELRELFSPVVCWETLSPGLAVSTGQTRHHAVGHSLV